MSVITSILTNSDADDTIDADKVSHKHCNPMYVHTPLTCNERNGSQDDTPVYCGPSVSPTNMCTYVLCQ